MELILGLLRIIGILVLAVILLVLVVVLLVLFCPLRYKAVITRELSDPPKGFVRVTWLLHLLSVRVEFDEELDYRIRVLGFSLLKGKDDLASKNQGHGDAEEKASEKAPEKEPEKAPEKAPGKAFGKVPEEAEEKSSRQTTDKKTEESKSEESDQVTEHREDKFRRTIGERIAELLQKLADFIEKISSYPDMILEKVDEWQQKKEKWLKHFQDEQHRTAIKALFGTAGSVLMHIKPRRLKIDGRLGFDDPAVTGQVFGLIGMLMPLYGETIHLEAIFDEAVAEGRLEARGRIRIGTLIYLLIRVIGKKEVRRLITQVKQLRRHK